MLTAFILFFILMLMTHRKTFWLPIFIVNRFLLFVLTVLLLISKIMFVHRNKTARKIYLTLFLDPVAYLYANTLPAQTREKKA